ncbi:MAG TPA: hypothetical protein VEY50_05380 [Lysobacter sp.]|nr:hypothetical protein [Lysobacter sp.]
MLRTLAASILAAGLLTGCATDLYSYRGGSGGGDYYYGRPQTEVRVYGGYYGHYGHYPHYRYGYPYYGPYGYYGPYRYYGPYDPYWHGGYGYPYRPHPRPRPPRPDQRNDLGDGGPWRNLDELRRRQSARRPDGEAAMPMPTPAPRVQGPPPRPRLEGGGGRLRETIRRVERDQERSSER